MWTYRHAVTGILLLCAVAVASACVSAPAPRPVYRDGRTVVELRTDRQAGSGHSHPAVVLPEQMVRILAGIRVHKNRYAVHRLIAGESEATPAFNAEEASALAPQLVKALEAATPSELVTFYRRFSDASTGLAFTTGGLFVRDGQMYVILANYRQSPADTMGIGIPAYEIDPVDDPLLSLRRANYSVSFVPREAEVHSVKGQWVWEFPDPGKIVIVILDLVLRSPSDPSHKRETERSGLP